MTTIGVFGASGRVGQLLVNLLIKDNEFTLGSVFALEELEFNLPPETVVTQEISTFLRACDCVIDFTAPQGTQNLLEVALNEQLYKPLVVGTTGLDSHQMNLLTEASHKMPILYATNMSYGVAMMNKLVAQASKGLHDFDCEIVEMHHRHKKDAPSGTALTLAHSAASARGLALDNVRVSGRDGLIGARSNDEIAVMSLRGGDIVGKHTVGFYADGEYIELTHVATSRETFAKGAIRAAHWLAKQPLGLYSIQDCLGV